MICYRITLDISKTITPNENGLTEYSREFIDQINTGFNRFNEKNYGSSFAFISDYNGAWIVINMIINNGSSVDDAVSALIKNCGFVGKYTIGETTVEFVRRYAENHYIRDFVFDDNMLEPFGMHRFGSNPKLTERVVDLIPYKEIKNQSIFGLYDHDLLPEIERIKQPAKCVGAKSHPVHYIIRCSNANKACDDLVSVLYENSRLISKRCTVIKPMTIRVANSLDIYFEAARYGSVVMDINSFSWETEDRAIYNFLTEQLTKLIMEYCQDTLMIFLMPNHFDSVSGTIKNSLPELTFIEINERLAMNNDAKKILRAYCRKDNVKADKELLSFVAKDTGYNSDDLRVAYRKWYANALKTQVYPQYSEFKKSLDRKTVLTQEGRASRQLAEMIGLREVKELIEQAVIYSKMQKAFADRGMPNAKRSMHMVFTGNPGTAKTTVARLFAQILKDNKILSVGNIIECGRSDLVGKYVGWTAVQVKQLFQKAQGSVLFIDEAYSLCDDRNGLFGDEAINTIVQEMENQREDMVVIFAGYPKEMKDFIDRNPGLRSRISFYVDFKDYSPSELYDITKHIAGNNGYKMADDTYEKLIPIFEASVGTTNHGNGRYARNLVEKAQLAQALRLSKCDLSALTGDELLTLKAEDFSNFNIGISDNENQPACRIGFKVG